jgi:hypothetical protein
VALGAEHVQPAERTDLVALGLRLLLELGEELVVAGERGDTSDRELLCLHVRERELVDERLGRVALLQHRGAGEPLRVATEDDVHAAPCHVRRHRDGMKAAGLADDLRLTRVLLRVQDLVGNPSLVEHLREPLALLDADRADEHGLAALVLLGDVVGDGAELADLALEDQVRLIDAPDGLVRRIGTTARP